MHMPKPDQSAQEVCEFALPCGEVPAGLNRTLEGAQQAAVDWRELLRRLWSVTAAADSSWMRPNRRHLLRGLYLPGAVRNGVSKVAIVVDCSGSISALQLSLFEAEARSILDGARPERVYVLYFDAAVHKVEIYETGQPIALNPVGGGGREFGLCFEWLEERGIPDVVRHVRNAVVRLRIFARRLTRISISICHRKNDITKTSS